MMRKLIVFLLLLFSITSPGCSDVEFDQLMGEYCDCISSARNQPEKLDKCREIMDSIKLQYKDDAIKLGDIIKRAGACY